MGGKQLGFGDDELSTAKKRSKREKFLAEMDKVVPWQALMADALIEVPAMRRFAVPAMRRFAGIDLIIERIPDEMAILSFRHLLE
jgi:IS5 family transposase